jgi:hypothetical protein
MMQRRHLPPSLVAIALACSATGCCSARHRPPAAAVAPGPPPTGDGDLLGYFVAPGGQLTISLVAGDKVVASGTAPSGGMALRAPSGNYELRFADAAGVALPGCTIRVTISAVRQTSVNEQPVPRSCPVAPWQYNDPRHPREPAHGTRADIKTAFGDYEGYRVEPCDPQKTDGMFFVTGTGTERAPDNADRKHDDDFNRWFERAQRRMTQAIAPMMGGAGFGAGCRKSARAGIIVYVSDWRQADEVLRRVARVLSDDDLGISVSIEMMPTITLL